jgi:hypothetical protein
VIDLTAAMTGVCRLRENFASFCGTSGRLAD